MARCQHRWMLRPGRRVRCGRCEAEVGLVEDRGPNGNVRMRFYIVRGDAWVTQDDYRRLAAWVLGGLGVSARDVVSVHPVSG
jgi:hypothetical protein